jgi:hypothetical protein
MLAPRHVAGYAVGHLAAFADAGLHRLFHLGQRRGKCQAKRGEDGGIAGEAEQHGERFRAMEVEIIGDRPSRPVAGGQAFAGCRIPVMAEGIECGGGHLAGQPQPFGGFPAPSSGQFLAAAEVVFTLTGVVGAGGFGVCLLVDAEHVASIRGASACASAIVQVSCVTERQTSSLTSTLGGTPDNRGAVTQS